jgi:acyl-ACP thioesterase
MRLFSLLNYLQDAAGEHSKQLHLSVGELHRRGLTWVLAHYRVRIARTPRFGEVLTVRTWPATREGKGSVRDFRIDDAQGQPVAVAASSWVLLDRESKRPVTIAEHLPDYPLHPERVFAGDFAVLDGVERPDLELTFRVRMADIDINRHVNNAVYVAWALESVPRALLDHALPVELEVQFRAEAFYEDRVNVRTAQLSAGDEPVFLHQLLRKSDGRELTRLRSRWRQLESAGEGELSVRQPGR